MALTPAQKEARRKILGGSDATTVMWGDSEAWRRLYNEKVNGIDPVFPESQQYLMDMGTAIEPLTLARFAAKHQALRVMPQGLVVHWKVDPWFACTPDAITLNGGYPVQAKFHTGDKNILELADRYGAQLLHEMLCLGAPTCYLAVTFGHYGRFQHLEVEQDEAAVDAYLQRASAFKAYVESGIEPDWMAAPVNLNIPRKRDHVWPVGDNQVAPLCQEMLATHEAVPRFERALADLKLLVPNDCASATWFDATGKGIKITVASNNAKRWKVVGVAPAPQPTAARVTLAKPQKVSIE